MTAVLEPPPDPVPVLTRKLQLLAQRLPKLYAELTAKEEQ